MRPPRRLAMVFRLILSLLHLAAWGCHGQGLQVWRTGEPSYLPFPVHEMVVSQDNRFVGLTVDPRPDPTADVIAGKLSIYLLDLKTGAHRLLGSGDSLLRATTGHQFLYYDSDESPIMLTEGLDEVRSFKIGKRRQGWWNPKNQVVIFETAWP